MLHPCVDRGPVDALLRIDLDPIIGCVEEPRRHPTQQVGIGPWSPVAAPDALVPDPEPRVPGRHVVSIEKALGFNRRGAVTQVGTRLIDEQPPASEIGSWWNRV